MSSEVEVEVTINVSEDGYRKFLDGMTEYFSDDLDQWNIFFNTTDGRLIKSGKRARVRMIIPKIAEPQYTICVKTAPVEDSITDGIAVRREIEAEITKEEIEAIIDNPSLYYKLAPQVIKSELEGFEDDVFAFAVDFRSQRRVYQLGDFKIEADECTLPSGEQFFQLELESDRPKEAKEALVSKLRELQIPYEEAKYGKFQILVKMIKGCPISARLQERINMNRK